MNRRAFFGSFLLPFFARRMKAPPEPDYEAAARYGADLIRAAIDMPVEYWTLPPYRCSLCGFGTENHAALESHLADCYPIWVREAGETWRRKIESELTL